MPVRITLRIDYGLCDACGAKATVAGALAGEDCRNLCAPCLRGAAEEVEKFVIDWRLKVRAVLPEAEWVVLEAACCRGKLACSADATEHYCVQRLLEKACLAKVQYADGEIGYEPTPTGARLVDQMRRAAGEPYRPLDDWSR